MQWEHLGILPSHLIFFFRHISQACAPDKSQRSVTGDLRRRTGGAHAGNSASLCVVGILPRGQCRIVVHGPRRHSRDLSIVVAVELRLLVHHHGHIKAHAITVPQAVHDFLVSGYSAEWSRRGRYSVREGGGAIMRPGVELFPSCRAVKRNRSWRWEWMTHPHRKTPKSHAALFRSPGLGKRLSQHEHE